MDEIPIGFVLTVELIFALLFMVLIFLLLQVILLLGSLFHIL